MQGQSDGETVDHVREIIMLLTSTYVLPRVSVSYLTYATIDEWALSNVKQAHKTTYLLHPSGNPNMTALFARLPCHARNPLGGF